MSLANRPTGRRPLKQAVRALKARSETYLRLLIVAAVAAVGFAAAFTVTATEEPDPVLLGTGPVGIMDTAESSGPLAAADVQDEAEPIGNGVDTGERGQATERGVASFYGRGFAGRPTASGETFNPQHMTAAHPSLPMGSRVRVTNVRTGRSVVVRINDRGPFAKNRIIDVSEAAARELGMMRQGVGTVQLELLRGRG